MTTHTPSLAHSLPSTVSSGGSSDGLPAMTLPPPLTASDLRQQLDGDPWPMALPKGRRWRWVERLSCWLGQQALIGPSRAEIGQALLDLPLHGALRACSDGPILWRSVSDCVAEHLTVTVSSLPRRGRSGEAVFGALQRWREQGNVRPLAKVLFGLKANLRRGEQKDFQEARISGLVGLLMVRQDPQLALALVQDAVRLDPDDVHLAALYLMIYHAAATVVTRPLLGQLRRWIDRAPRSGVEQPWVMVVSLIYLAEHRIGHEERSTLSSPVSDQGVERSEGALGLALARVVDWARREGLPNLAQLCARWVVVMSGVDRVVRIFVSWRMVGACDHAGDRAWWWWQVAMFCAPVRRQLAARAAEQSASLYRKAGMLHAAADGLFLAAILWSRSRMPGLALRAADQGLLLADRLRDSPRLIRHHVQIARLWEQADDDQRALFHLNVAKKYLLPSDDAWMDLMFSVRYVRRGASTARIRSLAEVLALMGRVCLRQDCFSDAELSLVVARNIWLCLDDQQRARGVERDLVRFYHRLTDGYRARRFAALADLRQTSRGRRSLIDRSRKRTRKPKRNQSSVERTLESSDLIFRRWRRVGFDERKTRPPLVGDRTRRLRDRIGAV